MGKYRKKPVVIEAVQYDGTFPLEFLSDDERVRSAGSGDLEIVTLEGVMRANVGDWIIRGVKGEVYPCKPDIFAATYDAADSPTSPALQAYRTSDTVRLVIDRWAGILRVRAPQALMKIIAALDDEPARQVAPRELGNFADCSTGTATPECCVCREPATCRRYIKSVNREVALCADCTDMHVQQLRDDSTARQVAREEGGDGDPAGWKAWHRKLIELLPSLAMPNQPNTRIINRDATLEAVRELVDAQPTRSSIAAKVVEAIHGVCTADDGQGPCWPCKQMAVKVESALTAMRVGREDA